MRLCTGNDIPEQKAWGQQGWEGVRTVLDMLQGARKIQSCRLGACKEATARQDGFS